MGREAARLARRGGACQVLGPAKRPGKSSQLSPAAITQAMPLGWVRMMVKLPVSEARTSIMPPLLAKPMATGNSEYTLSRFSTTVRRSPHIACAPAAPAGHAAKRAEIKKGR